MLRYTPKGFVPVFAVLVALAIPTLIMAWGPQRDVYTMQQPADHVTFNSITDNPNYGDERQFVTIRDNASGQATDSANMVPGHEYTVQIYIHNDAASNLNASGVGVAKDVKVRAQVPATVNGQETVDGFVSASNAKPAEVYDSADLKSTGQVQLEYVGGSGKLSTATQQTALPDSLATSGVTVGDSDLSGVWHGCIEYAGAVTFKIRVKDTSAPNFSFTKQVSKHGASKYGKDYTATPGETVDFALAYKNTGNTTQNNVQISDALPAGMTYVAGSSTIINANNPNGIKTSDGVTAGGLNVGNYAPTANAVIMFSATAPAASALQCGDNKVVNTAKAETDNGTKQDTANIIVKKDCQPVKEAAIACTGLQVNSISRTQFSFKASNTIDNASFVKYVYVVKDANGNTVKTIDGSADQAATFTADTVGKYSVTASVIANVNGQEKTVSSSDCQKPFEVTPEAAQPSYTCDSLKMINKKARDTFSFEAKANANGGATVKEYRFDFGDGQSKIVGPGQEIQDHTYAQPGNYTAKLEVSFTVDGKTIPNVSSNNCTAAVTVDQAPTTPALPETGPETIALSGLVGSGVLGYGVHTYARSRRQLKKAFRK